MSTPLLVAIDGPAGVGKTTTARGVAEALGIPYIDTGAMYRAVAWLVLENGVDPGSEQQVLELLTDRPVRLAVADGSAHVELSGRRLGDEIRTPEVSATTSRVAVHPGLRELMVVEQRRAAREQGAVMEGRDIGTVVFPETPHKFFLSADARERARRRFLELEQKGHDVSLSTVERDLESRDQRDRGRDVAPLVCNDSYRQIDTSALTPDEVVATIVKHVRAQG